MAKAFLSVLNSALRAKATVQKKSTYSYSAIG